jgi:pimeloyl-ACP methyl ester carboxylesterase
VRITTDDGVGLDVTDHGEPASPAGAPMLFVHEFGGDQRSWAPQVAHFRRTRRCVTYNARGYPPSDVPTDPAAYHQDRAVADAVAVLDALGLDRAVVVGNSMGGFATLHLGLRHPDRCVALVVAGCGYGAAPERAGAFRADALALADAYERDGSDAVALDYGNRPARQPLRRRDQAAHAEHLRILAEHDPVGAALTMRGVQAARPSLFDLQEDLAGMAVPTLLLVGDTDPEALDATLMLRSTLPDAGLAVLPRTGHLTNLELPVVVDALIEEFVDSVASRRTQVPEDSVLNGAVGLAEPLLRALPRHAEHDRDPRPRDAGASGRGHGRRLLAPTVRNLAGRVRDRAERRHVALDGVPVDEVQPHPGLARRLLGRQRRPSRRGHPWTAAPADRSASTSTPAAASAARVSAPGA